MTSAWRRRLLLGCLVVLSGCGSCSQPEPPDNYSVERMTDPYDKVPPRGTVSDEERAVAVVDYAGEQLHYGRVPAHVLRYFVNARMMKYLVPLLADGKDESIKVAWDDLLNDITSDRTVPSEIKVRLRQAEGRVDDYINTKANPDLLRRERLAEIAWSLYQLAPLAPDAGSK